MATPRFPIMTRTAVDPAPPRTSSRAPSAVAVRLTPPYLFLPSRRSFPHADVLPGAVLPEDEGASPHEPGEAGVRGMLLRRGKPAPPVGHLFDDVPGEDGDAPHPVEVPEAHVFHGHPEGAVVGGLHGLDVVHVVEVPWNGVLPERLVGEGGVGGRQGHAVVPLHPFPETEGEHRAGTRRPFLRPDGPAFGEPRDGLQGVGIHGDEGVVDQAEDLPVVGGAGGEGMERPGFVGLDEVEGPHGARRGFHGQQAPGVVRRDPVGDQSLPTAFVTAEMVYRLRRNHRTRPKKLLGLRGRRPGRRLVGGEAETVQHFVEFGL